MHPPAVSSEGEILTGHSLIPSTDLPSSTSPSSSESSVVPVLRCSCHFLFLGFVWIFVSLGIFSFHFLSGPQWSPQSFSTNFAVPFQPEREIADYADSELRSPSESVSYPAYSKYLPLCGDNHSNVVLLRKRGANDAVHEEDQRIWSINRYTFDLPRSIRLPLCNTTQHILQAIQFGHRYPVPGYDVIPLPRCNNCTSPPSELEQRNAVEYRQSYFVPDQCTIPVLSSSSTCSVLSQYSHVYWQGDSLTRHTAQALYMLLTEDLRYGALPRLSSKPVLYDKCTCDGQFSEHEVCRDYAWANIFNLQDTRAYGVCSETAARWRLTYLSDPTFNLDFLCSDDPRPIFFYFHFGVHYAFNATRALIEGIIPTLQAVSKAHHACPHPLSWRVVWGGGSAQSRLLDKAWPHQSRENVAFNFNRRVHAFLHTALNLPILDWWNLTLNAASSDGQHYMSEINLLKANGILAVMKTMMDQQFELNITAIESLDQHAIPD